MPDATILDYFKRLDKSQGQKRRISSQPRNETPPPPKRSKKDGDNDAQKRGAPSSMPNTLHTRNYSGGAATPSRGQTPILPIDDQLVRKSALPPSLANTVETTPRLPKSYTTAARGTAPMASASLHTPPPTVRPQEKRSNNPLDPLFDPLSLPHFPPPPISASFLPLPADGPDRPQAEGFGSGDDNKAAVLRAVLMRKTEKNTSLQAYSEVAPSSSGSNYRTPPPNKSGTDNLLSLSPDFEMATVPSSQTQLLHPGFPLSSPQHRIQRPPGKSATYYNDPDDLDIVQSSQSIEKEVDISMGLSQFLPTPSTSGVSRLRWGEPERQLVRGENRPQPSSPTQWRSSQSHPPARSHSEVLFGFPMQEPEIANLFLDDPIQEEPDPPLPSARSDSATESDSDNEDHFSHKVSQFRKANRYVIRNSSPTQPGKHDLPADPTFDHPIAAHSSPATQSSNSIPQSLPQCVKEFRDMFDNGDGSYPPDFPEDLR